MAEKIVDGGLEIWTSPTNLTDWAESVSGASTVNREAGEKYGGAYSARLDIDGSNSNAQIYTPSGTPIVLTPGAAYVLSGWYKNSAAGKTAKVTLNDSGSNVGLKSDGTWAAYGETIVLPNATAWTRFTIAFKAHASYSNYRLYAARYSAASSSIYFDDLSILDRDPLIPNIAPFIPMIG